MAKKGYNLDELRAFKMAFDSDITKSDKRKYLLIPGALSSGIFLLFLTPDIKWSPVKKVVTTGVTKYVSDGKFHADFFFGSFITNLPYFIGALIFFVLGYLYGKYKLMPLQIEREYKEYQFIEKNRFVNSLTQLLTNDGLAVLTCLNEVSKRTTGQFKNDVMKLVYSLRSADDPGKIKAINTFTERYRSDLIFVQYMDQILVSLTNGRGNLETLQNLKDYHNEIKLKQSEFETKKINLMMSMVAFGGLISGMIVFFHFMPMGWDAYMETYVHSVIGWVGFGLYYVIVVLIFNKLINGLYDDNILSTGR